VDGIKNVLFNGHCHLSFANDASVCIGDNFICNSGIIFGGLVNDVSKMIVSKGASLSIGSNVGISSTVIFAKRSISIGNNVNVGGGTLIIDSNFHSTDWRVRLDRKQDQASAISLPVIINDNVFIGARCIICKGVSIGQNTIVAAGSVVVKSLPSNCIAGGNPCKVIKYL